MIKLTYPKVQFMAWNVERKCWVKLPTMREEWGNDLVKLPDNAEFVFKNGVLSYHSELCDILQKHKKHSTINKKNTMPIDDTFDADLQELANKHQVHISGTATPINPDLEAFDISAQAVAVDASASSAASGDGSAAA